MPSRGAPPYKKSGLSEFEMQQLGIASSEATLFTGSAELWGASTQPVKFYGNSTGTVSWSLHSSGLYGWKCSETALSHNLAKYGASGQMGFPCYTKFSDIPEAATRLRRYIYEAVLHRESIAEGGAFEFGVYFGGILEKGFCGVAIRSVDTIYGGNWHVGHRFQTDGSITALADSGVAGDGDPVHARLEYIDGPARSLVALLNGKQIGALSSADLPVAGVDDHDPAGTILSPGFGAAATGAGDNSWCLLPRFAMERLT